MHADQNKGWKNDNDTKEVPQLDLITFSREYHPISSHSTPDKSCQDKEGYQRGQKETAYPPLSPPYRKRTYSASPPLLQENRQQQLHDNRERPHSASDSYMNDTIQRRRDSDSSVIRECQPYTPRERMNERLSPDRIKANTHSDVILPNGRNQSPLSSPRLHQSPRHREHYITEEHRHVIGQNRTSPDHAHHINSHLTFGDMPSNSMLPHSTSSACKCPECIARPTGAVSHSKEIPHYTSKVEEVYQISLEKDTQQCLPTSYNKTTSIHAPGMGSLNMSIEKISDRNISLSIQVNGVVYRGTLAAFLPH